MIASQCATCKYYDGKCYCKRFEHTMVKKIPKSFQTEMCITVIDNGDGITIPISDVIECEYAAGKHTWRRNYD